MLVGFLGVGRSKGGVFQPTCLFAFFCLSSFSRFGKIVTTDLFPFGIVAYIRIPPSSDFLLLITTLFIPMMMNYKRFYLASNFCLASATIFSTS